MRVLMVSKSLSRNSNWPIRAEMAIPQKIIKYLKILRKKFFCLFYLPRDGVKANESLVE